MEHVTQAHGLAEIQCRSRDGKDLAGFQIVGVGGVNLSAKTWKVWSEMSPLPSPWRAK